MQAAIRANGVLLRSECVYPTRARTPVHERARARVCVCVCVCVVRACVLVNAIVLVGLLESRTENTRGDESMAS